MPKLSDTMEEGTVLQWLVADGEAVAKGQPLVEIETDKATMTVEAPEEGTLHVIAAEGDARAVGEPIAEIGGAGAVRAGARDARARGRRGGRGGLLHRHPHRRRRDRVGDRRRARLGGDLPRGPRGRRGGGGGGAGGAPRPCRTSIPSGRRPSARTAGARRPPPSRGAWPASSAWTSRRCAAPARTAGSCAPTWRPPRAGDAVVGEGGGPGRAPRPGARGAGSPPRRRPRRPPPPASACRSRASSARWRSA